jgi:hypothetical protein
MTTVELHHPPRFADVVREQFKATALSLRLPAIGAAAITAVVTFLAFADFFSGRGGVEFAPELSMVPGLAGVILPIAAWYSDRRFVPGFLWTLPVDRVRHALAKVIAGWLLLMIGTVGFMIWLLLLALITKGNIVGDEVIKLLPISITEPVGLMDPAALRTITWIPPKWLWLIPFFAATGAYVITSACALGIRHPFRWIAAVVAAGFLGGAVLQGMGSQSLWIKMGNVLEAITQGRYGIDGLLTAGAESLHTQVVLTTGQRVGVWRALPNATDWILATLLWTGLGIAGLSVALFRHRESR